MLVAKSTTLNDLVSDTTLKSKAASFLEAPHLAQPHEDFTDGIPYLYVGQGELAYSYHSHPLALVSDDATTCCIVMLHDSARFCLAHVDSSKQVRFLFDHWKSTRAVDDSSTTKVHVVGGYEDENGTGHAIVESILSAMQVGPRPFQVELWVTGPLNTLPPNASSAFALPRARGALCIGSAAGCAASSVDFAPNTYRGPLFNQRMACTPSTPLHLLKTCPALECTLGPYTRLSLTLQPSDEPKFQTWIDDASDEEFLSRWSTSPYAEGPKFVADVKARFQFCIDQVGRHHQHTVLHRTQRYQYDCEIHEWVGVL
ncbi:hypothetical protein B5M09_010906 [Aphanomyces astaci]|uniref:Uncharacterized protein n=1 Tax=Aphanomyces astaci TaxID=112090 RepID=A0A425CSR7_APHAT|nr:hypothetical protein B5M09_010906 [Aphanomyces astaci]